ncbi:MULTISPECIES: lipopolysaccharide biosynthesis protein [Colwellia]|uniref:Capsule polysaccharide transporter n=1 Tax=Colwellia marinimaniae TaxID=1513592 RepID=A0ABQ0N189_9GAMM|nr:MULTISPECIES: lipopolysaccharide biosynthesis protein [Colwellia]GAW97796.1 capsule polysaccharide transporter [Colwellia marinimaniae]
MPEQRFLQLRNALKPEEFNSVIFLKQKAEKIKTSDPQLSARILVRVNNLEKQQRMKVEKRSMGPVVKLSSEPVALLKRLQALTPAKVFSVFLARMQTLKQSSFMWFVVLPSLLFAIYQIFIATERFESQAQIIVQQPDAMATMDAGMAFLTGMGVPTGGSDSELIKAYVYSNDMVTYLNQELDLRGHYSQNFIDYFSGIHKSDTREELLAYYQERVKVIINEKSGIITIYSQGFDSEFAQQLTNKIVKRAEWFINSIGHQLANAQLGFIQGEHENIEQRFAAAQTNLLNFQQQYNLLDPMAEGIAMQQITYTLEGQIAVKQTELKTIQAIMSAKAPQVKALKNELNALKSQLKSERSKLAQSGQEELAVSELLAKFTDFKIKMELALQAYTSSQISLEKSRIEAYRQMKYLIVVEQATLSEENKYPGVFYNISLFLLLLSMIFGIARIIFATIQELK